MRIRVAAAVVLATLAAAPALAAPEEDRGQLWRELQEPVDALVELNREMPGLPDWAMLGRTRGDAQSEIRRLLDEAIGILQASEAADVRAALRETDARLAELDEALAKARFDRVGAPPPAEPEGLGDELLSALDDTETTADYDAEIARLQAETGAERARQETLKREFHQALVGIGVALPRETTDGLLSTVVGDDIVDLQVAYGNLAAINAALQEATLASGESPETVRRYYGIYVVLLQILSTMQAEVAMKIDQDYLVRLDGIAGATAALRGEAAARLAATLDTSHQEVLRANMAAHDTTLKVIELYRTHLQAQRDVLGAAMAQTAETLAVADNTARTVNLAGDLVGLIHDADADLKAILAITPPPLQPFRNLELQREFDALTRRLSGS